MAALVEAATQIFAPGRLALPSLACSFVARDFNLQYRTKKQTSFGYFSRFNTNMADRIDETSGNNDYVDRGTGTRYQVSSTMNDEKNKRIRISFDSSDDTTYSSKRSQKPLPNNDRKKFSKEEVVDDGTQEQGQSIPESVLRYQRQLRKIQAADRASKTNVNILDHLHTVYFDDHVVVTNKPSGILCVPGVNKNKSLLDLVFEVYGSAKNANGNDDQSSSTTATATPSLPRDCMIAHRLDMDTSGIIIWARTRLAMSKLHESFRERAGTKKIYEALLVGWLDIDRWLEKYADAEEIIGNGNKITDDSELSDETGDIGGGEINLPLQRDHRHPPFMRVSTPESEAEAREAVKDLNHAGYKKLIAKRPKPSTTRFRILSHEKWMGFPVTRVELTPITGRTHQLRVHCAAMGHPILGDPAYGFCGEAHPNGGFADEVAREMSPTCAGFELRRDVEDAVRENGRVMCLHARQLTLEHPVTKENISFEAAPSF